MTGAKFFVKTIAAIHVLALSALKIIGTCSKAYNII